MPQVSLTCQEDRTARPNWENERDDLQRLSLVVLPYLSVGPGGYRTKRYDMEARFGAIC